MIRITKIESVLGNFGIHYYRKRTEETAAAIKVIAAAVGERIFRDILTAIDGAESEAFKDGIELGRVYQASGVGSYADFKNKVRELLEECPPDDISEDLAKFLMDGEEDGV